MAYHSLPHVIQVTELHTEAECAYVLFVVAIFWLVEAMPLAITALIPALMFPLFGIMKASTVANSYFRDFHLLLIGIICLAASIEKWNLHKRIALRMVMLVGVNPEWLMLGFMVSSAFLSMWLSNTSTAAMVMPIVEAVVQQIISAEAEVEARERSNTNMNGNVNLGLELNEHTVENESDKWKFGERNGYNGEINPYPMNMAETVENDDPNLDEYYEKVPEVLPLPSVSTYDPDGKYRSRKDHLMCKGMSLCIAYASTIGGITTITGTSSNLIFAEQFNTRYPECHCINFGTWFIVIIPMMVIILIFSWIWLNWLFIGFNFNRMFKCGKQKSDKDIAAAQVIKDEYRKMGPISYEEIITLVIFVLMALLWFTREPGFIPGWSSLFPKYRGYATDSTPALMLGILFFIIPAKKTFSEKHNKKAYTPLITWKEFQSCMPWEIALLVGGGFALADGCEDSGLSVWIGSKLEPLGSLPTWVIILISSLMVTTVTEVASNPATITIFIPILAPLAEATHVNPLFILIPATLCTSYAFLLPVSNPPNAIAFGYGHLTVIDMVKAGLGVNIIGVAVTMLGVLTWAVPIYNLDSYPDWAPSVPSVNSTRIL
ncbi:solute carrier family 13 member 1 [Protopterus annectens]|uniref:solute carrier family 13 member 1 n=1 Tax=Protopterus annectens TaxID=7888 RepID=UPI001CF9863B|nr:solute carrier family 13 member 1 [Protopterus annectens]